MFQETRSRHLARAVAGAAVLAVLATLATSAGAQQTTRVSVSSTGDQGNSFSGECSISADGQVVAFSSNASNLVANDSNGIEDVFVHDRTTGITSLVSKQSNGSKLQCWGVLPSLSGNGQVVAFVSGSDNLVDGDTNGVDDVFVHDLATGVTERVSVDSSGAEGNFASGRIDAPALSSDGRFVAFESLASNLVTGDSNGGSDVFVHDRSTGTTERVSVDSSGAEADGESFSPAISADGQIVAFESVATNLVAGDRNRMRDVFVHDRASGITERVSVDSSGVESEFDCWCPSLSADGRFVAFSTDADNLVACDTNNEPDVFVHDRATGTTERVSVASSGAQASGNLGYYGSSSLSSDGRFVAFESCAWNLAATDTNNYCDVFVHDRSTGATRVASVDSSGAEGYGENLAPSISADGQTVAFTSVEETLVSDDTNWWDDVFVHEHCRVPASWSNYGAGFPGTNGVPSLAPQANPVMGSNLAIDVGNSSGLFTFGMLFVGVQRASIHSNWGGDLLVAPMYMTMLGLAPGGTTVFGDVPDDDALCGATVDLQAVEADPGAAHGVSFTAGVELVLGN